MMSSRPFESLHFLTGEELSQSELQWLILSAERMRQQRGGPNELKPLQGKTIALLFEKPSLRTRVSFTVGIQELGGTALELVSANMKNEEPEDSIRVLQGMVHGLMYRTFEHRTLERMSQVARIPILNGLSDEHHPCQAIADLLTLHQTFGQLKGLTLAYLGDGNNVLHSLLLLAPYLGVNVNYACPVGRHPDGEILSRAQKRAHSAHAQIRSFESPLEAVRGAHAVYTDVWASMGRENEFERDKSTRLQMFQPYQLNLELFQQAAPDAIAMHCLPMVRGQEITSEVVEHPRSALFRQAENRLHAQKALIAGLFAGLAQKRAKELSYSHVV